jgi:hypothetical protein
LLNSTGLFCVCPKIGTSAAHAATITRWASFQQKTALSSASGLAFAEPISGHASSGFGTLMQHFRAEGFLNKRLELSAQLKASEVTGAGSLWMRIDGDKGRTLAFDNLDGRKSDGPLVGTVGWQDRSIVMDVPPEAQSIHFGFFLRGGGSVWARRFRFTDVDASVQVTDHVIPRMSAPTNLDFAAVA